MYGNTQIERSLLYSVRNTTLKWSFYLNNCSKNSIKKSQKVFVLFVLHKFLITNQVIYYSRNAFDISSHISYEFQEYFDFKCMAELENIDRNINLI